MASFWDTPAQQQQRYGGKSFWDQEETKPAKPESRGFLGAANDYVIEAANAILGGGKALIDFAVPGTELANQIEDLIRQGEESQSDVARQAKQRLGEDIEAGGMQALKGVGSYIVENPALALSQAVGSFAIPMGAIRGSQMAARGLGVGERAVARASDVGPITRQAAVAAERKALERVGTGAGMGIGAALGAGEAGGDAYGQVYEGLIEQGVDPVEADRQATEAARLAMPAPAIVGAIAGRFGAEKAVAARSRQGSILRMAGTEAAQEFAEEGTTKLSANVAAGQYIDGIDPMKGVLGSAALGAALGGMTGAAIGTITPIDKQPGSMLSGANDNLQGSRTPSGDAIRQAINTGPKLPDVISVTTRGEAFVTPEQQQAYQQFGQMGGRVDTAVPGRPATTPPSAPAGTAQPSAQPTARVQPAQSQPVSQEEYLTAARIYGLAPAANMSNAWDLGGARIYGQPTVKAVVEGLAQADRQLSPVQRTLNGAFLAANVIKLSGNIANAKPVVNALNKATQKYGLVDVGSTQEALARIDDQIAALARQGKPATNPMVEQLDAIYTALTGQSSPLYTQLLEGTPNEPQQQAATRVGAVSEQAGTDATVGTAGRTDLGSVQSLLTGGVPGGPAGLQNVPAGDDRTRDGAIVTPAGEPTADVSAVSGQRTDQGGEVSGLRSAGRTGEGTQADVGRAAGAGTTRTEGTGAGPAAAAVGTQQAGKPRQVRARAEEDVTLGKQLFDGIAKRFEIAIRFNDLDPALQEVWLVAVENDRTDRAIVEALAQEQELIRNDVSAQQILDLALTRLYPADKQAAKRSFILEMYGTPQAKREESVAELAKRYNRSIDTIKKDWNRAIRDLLGPDKQKLTDAIKAAMVELRLSDAEATQYLTSLMDSIKAEQTEGRITEAEVEELTIDEAELGAEDAAITARGRATASLQEVNKAAETNNQKFLRISQALDAIEARQKPTRKQIDQANEALRREKNDIAELTEKQLETLAIDAYLNDDEFFGDRIVKELNDRLEVTEDIAEKQAAKKPITAKGEPRAVQKQTAAKVPVQPRARGGEKVGQEVRGAEKPAATGEAKTEGQVVAIPDVPGVDVVLRPKLAEFPNSPVNSFSFSVPGASAQLHNDPRPLSYNDPNQWTLGLLKAEKPGSGAGSKLLNAITAWADKNNVTLVTVAAADTPSGKKLTQDQLIEFYQKRGFEPDEKSRERIAEGVDYSGLIRYPKAAVALTKAEQVEAKYNELRAFAPDLIPVWGALTVAQRDSLLAIDNPADINVRNLEQILDESKVIDVEAREIAPAERRLMLEKSNTLTDEQTQVLQAHYKAKAGTDAFLSKLSQDIANYTNKGAEFVAARIRAIIAQLAKAVVAVAIVFNPTVQQNGFNFNLPEAYAKAKQITIELPTSARSKMSPMAQSVFTEMAATAQISGKGFIIADKPNGMIHVFDKDGNVIAQDTALYGRDVGDVLGSASSLEGGKKVTPAGKYALEAVKLRDGGTYAGGYTLDLVGTNDGTGTIAIHAAYLGNVNEKRLERLASPDVKDNRVSYGCINTSHKTFLDKIIPNINKLDGGMVFVLPDSPETFSMPAAPTAPQPAKTPKQNAMRRRAEEKVQEVTGSKDNLMIEDASLDEMAEAYEGVSALRDRFNALGIGNAFNAVGQFFVSYNPNVDWDGIITNIDQKVAIVLRQDIAASRGNVMWTMAHEIGHAVDQAVQGQDTYSSDPRLNLRLVNGKLVPMGEVAIEMSKLYNTDEAAKAIFGYPFDPKEVEGLSLNEMRQELFAQIWAFYTSGPVGQRILEQKAPATAKFMKEVLARVQETTDFQATDLGQEVSFDSRAEGVAAGRGAIPGEAAKGQAPKVLRNRRADAAINRLPDTLQPQATQIFYTLKDWASKAAPTFAFTQDLVDMAKGKLKSVTRFVQLYNEQQVIQTEYELRVKAILDDYDALPAEVRGTGPNSVNAFIKDSTMSGKWGYKIKEESDVTPDPALEARFNAFPKEAQKVIKDVFKHGYDVLQDMKRTLRENTNSEFDALIEEARAKGNEKEVAELQAAKDLTLKNYQKLFALQGKKPYAPLKRFGDYVVVGKSQRLLDAEEIYRNSKGSARALANKTLTDLQTDPQHYYVGFAETAGEGQVIANQLRRQFPDMQVTDPFEKSAQESLYGGNDLNQVFARLRNLVDENLKSSDKDVVVRGVRKMILDLQTQMLSNQSIMHATNRRLGIAGADDDMMRAFATQGRASAHFIGSLSNTGKIYEQLRNMSNESKNDPEARRYFNEFVRRHAMGFDYDPSPVLNKAMATTSLWMLLTSPAYYLQNMTQPLMMSVPFMAGKHGEGRSLKAMFAAYKEVGKLLQNISVRRPGEQVDFSNLPEDVRGMVEDLVKRGRIQITLDRDLGEFTSGEDSAFKKLGKVSGYLQAIAEKTELINRVSTAVAAYRLAIGNRESESAARDYADKVIRVTHGDYSGANAPRFMRKGIGRLVTQFRKFQLIQLSMMIRLLNDATRGATAEDKRAARYTLLWVFTHAGVAGGIMGLPGFAAAAALYGMLFGDEDEPFEPELELRRYFGDEIGTLMTKGLPAQMGVDVSGKIGAGQMLSILPYADFDLSKAGWQEVVTAAMGPFIGGLAPRVIDGISYMNDGNYYKGVENLMPKGITDTLKAARFATEGVTQRNNDVSLSADEISFADAMFQALGLPTTKLTERQFRTGVVIRTEEFFDKRTAEIKRNYTKAYRENDVEAIAEARDAWKRVQDARVASGFTRQPLSNLLKAPQEQRKRERQTEGGVQYTQANRRFVESLP